MVSVVYRKLTNQQINKLLNLFHKYCQQAPIAIYLYSNFQLIITLNKFVIYMISGIKFKLKRSPQSRKFQEFIFIGDSADRSVSNEIEQLHNTTNNTIARASIEDSLKITEIKTNKEIAHQLKNFQIKIGAIVKLINKSENGSVVVSHDDRLIGIGAEIARQIAAIEVN